MILGSQRPLMLIAAALIAAVSACSGSTDDVSAEGVRVVVTTTVLGDIASEVVGGGGTVSVLLPVGASPHDYDVSSAQIADIYEADLVIANGLGLEESVLDVLETAESDGVNVLIVGEHLDPVTVVDREPCAVDEPSDPDGDDHGHGQCDPHVWFDTARDTETAHLISGQLAAIDPTTDWAANANSYAEALASADAEIEQVLSAIPVERRYLVTNHHSFGYFADRYGFEVVGTVIPGGSALSEPSSAELAHLVDIINETGVPALFAETSEPTALASAIAAEVDHDVVVIELYTGSIGEPGSDADTLIGMLMANARRIADGLS